MLKVLVVLAVVLGVAALAARAARAARQRQTPATSSPSTDGDLDQRVLDALRAHGADLRKPTETIFFLAGLSSEAAADAAAATLRAEGFQAEVITPVEDDSRWSCWATTEMVPELAAIKRIGRCLSELARTHGGEYDGWEAAVTT